MDKSNFNVNIGNKLNFKFSVGGVSPPSPSAGDNSVQGLVEAILLEKGAFAEGGIYGTARGDYPQPISELVASDFNDETKTWKDRITGEVYHDDGAQLSEELGGVASNIWLPEIPNYRETGFTLLIRAKRKYITRWQQIATFDVKNNGEESGSLFTWSYYFRSNYTNKDGVYSEVNILYNSGNENTAYTLMIYYDPSDNLMHFCNGTTETGTMEISEYDNYTGIKWRLSRQNEDDTISSSVTLKCRLFDTVFTSKQRQEAVTDFEMGV